MSQEALHLEIQSFLSLSRQIGSGPAQLLYEREKKRQQRQSTWQWKLADRLERGKYAIGLGGFNSYRFRRIAGMVEADLNRVIDPLLTPILAPVLEVIMHDETY